MQDEYIVSNTDNPPVRSMIKGNTLSNYFLVSHAIISFWLKLKPSTSLNRRHYKLL